MRKRIITIILSGSTVLAVHHGPAPQDTLPTHHCHEDEYQYVTPQGLTCEPIDGGEPRVVATEYEFARP